MIAAAFIASLISVAAFSPARMATKATGLKMSFENEPGVLPPVGFFDPYGFTKDGSQENFDRRRTVELKHGRIAQLAVIGYIVPEIYKFPGDIAPGIPFASVPNGLAALDAIPTLGWLQIFFLIGAVDYWGVLTLGDTEGKGKTAEELFEQKTKELQNGRLAMIAILELLRHDYGMLSGAYPGDHLITGLPFLY
jgi:hypothetical protein